MNDKIFQIGKQEIKSIEKFYVFYYTSLITFNHGLNSIRKDIHIELNNPKIIVSHLTDSPDKPHQRIDIEANDLKNYALNEGQSFVFRSCIIYLYSIIENVIIYKKFNKTTDE